MSQDLAPNQKAQHFWPTAKRLLGQFGPEKVKVAFSIVLAFFSVVCNIAAPYFLGRATDLLFEGYTSAQMAAGQSKQDVVDQLAAQGQDNQAAMVAAMDIVPGAGIDFTALSSVLLLTVVLYLVSETLMWQSGAIANRAMQRTLYRMREFVETKLHKLPLSFVDRQKKGDILSRLNNDLDNISTVLNESFQQLATNIMMVIGVLVVMFTLSPTLALITLVSIPLTAIVIGIIGVRSQKEFAGQWAATGGLNAHVEEAITGQQLLQVYGATGRARETFKEGNDRVYSSSVRATALSGSMMPAMQFVSNIVFVGIAVVGSVYVATGSMSLGTVQAFIQYSRQFSQPLAQLGGMASQLQSGVASAERVFDLLDAEEEPASAPRNPALGATRGDVEFHDVSFAYDPDRPLIEHLDLHAEPGRTVAIVGHTGAGKTTLVNLLLRFYDVTEGSITLDGIDIRELDRDQLREPIGMVLQDTWLFEGTIWDNIAYGRSSATDEEILDAAKAAYVDRFVHHLPEGYDTRVTETGDNISQGERQLITIARAFVAAPVVLVLDEATSSVDTRTEVLVQDAMNTLRSGRTSFVIAHRLSTIRNADLIVVMDSGHIVEQGTHVELLAADGMYADLHRSQFVAEEHAEEDAETVSVAAEQAPGAFPGSGDGEGTGPRG